jgi:branched-chain amino acid transport system ATP-binding protein/branched-chain amino acid transport system permease protein
MSRMRAEGIVLALLVLLPWLAPVLHIPTDVLTRTLIWGLFGLGFDILFGFTGMLSFGQAAFYGTGGFVSAWLLTSHALNSVPLALLIGTALATVYGLIVGFISLRRIGIYFAMITLAFGEMSFFLENSPLAAWTGGENGLPGVPSPSFSLLGHVYEFNSEWSLYAFIAAIYFVGYAVARRIVASPYGVVLRAIKSNARRAPAVGHDAQRYKLSAFVLAAAYAGLAGGLLGVFQGYMPPDAFFLSTSGQLVLSTVIGGRGTLIGPLIGAFTWIDLRNLLQQVPHLGAAWKLIFGGIFVLIVTLFRRGIAGEIGAWLARRRRAREAPPSAESAARRRAAARLAAASNRPAARTPAAGAVLEVRDLAKRYGDFVAVAGISLDVREGELLAIIGPNGAGKSTLLNVLAGDLEASDGRIVYKGTDITRSGVIDICHRGISKTYQINELFADFSVCENVEIALLAHTRGRFRADCFRSLRADRSLRERAEAILDEVGLLPFANHPTAEMSYGEKRRLEIALALANEPQLLFMDEPLAGMSPVERAEAVQLIARLAAQRTVVLVEHDMDAVFRLADRIVVMQNGVKLAEGTPQDIQHNDEVQQAYLGGVEAHEPA